MRNSRKQSSVRVPTVPPAAAHAPATSYDVARRAGVSQSAVSRSFMQGASASPKMRKRVLNAARELGYRPNAIARTLITRRSGLLAVILPNLTSLYYPEVLAELATEVTRRGLRILLFTVRRESDVDSMLDQVLQYQVDGIISAARMSPNQLALFAQRRVPVVLFNRYLRDVATNAICCDQVDGARILVTRLHDAGHRRFGIIAGPVDSVVGQERLGASIERLRELGIRNTPVVVGNFDYESGRKGLHELVKILKRPPQAVICTNDHMAIGCIDAARSELELEVPRQISVVGFDGVGPSTWLSYRLTTFRQPIARLAEASVALLIERIENPDLSPEKRVFAGILVEGSSARLGKAL